MLASTLALGNPFHFDTLQDPFGHYLGQTSTGGTVFWDLFYSDMLRMSYNFLLVGAMESGKSTLLKIIMKERAIRGDFIRVFDVEGEFVNLCKYLGGKEGEEKSEKTKVLLKALKSAAAKKFLSRQKYKRHHRPPTTAPTDGSMASM